MQFVLGYSPLAAGIRLLPFAGVILVMSPLSAKLVERLGTKVDGRERAGHRRDRARR